MIDWMTKPTKETGLFWILIGISIGICLTSFPWIYYEINEIREEIAEIEELFSSDS
jgi:hypothetical protein